MERTAGLIGVTLTPPGCNSIAASCRGTPRIANRLLRRVRDVASVRGEGVSAIDQALVGEALSLHRVDHRGLDASDRRLHSCRSSPGGGPVGLETLAAALEMTPSPWRPWWSRFAAAGLADAHPPRPDGHGCGPGHLAEAA